jgi:hypothetical protein
MKLRNTVLIGSAVAMAAMLQTAQATLLGDLFNHSNGSDGSLTIGDKTFSGFSWTATGDNASALSTDAAGLTVTASQVGGVYYLDFAGLIAENNISGASSVLGDVALHYTVTVNSGPGVIDWIDQQYTPNGLPVAGNQIIIGETANGATASANSTLTLNPSDLSDPPVELGDNLLLVPGQTQVIVVKDILIAAAAGQLVGLSDVKQSYHQVPEPTTMLAGALLLLPFGASTLRILRKNRMS